MINRSFFIFDMETDGLYKEVTKIHCLSYQEYKNGMVINKDTLVDYNDIIDFFSWDGFFVGHNIIRYDIPVSEKVLDIIINLDTIDTLGISWHLYPSQKIHGLGNWGEFLGFGKPIVEDWKTQPLEVYINRCESDVEINTRLFKFFFNYLSKIYDNFEDIIRLVGYCNYKLDCVREQEMSGIDIDMDNCHIYLKELEVMFDEKRQILSNLMPNELGKIIKSKPKVMFKQDGNLSVYGQKWVEETSNRGLNFDEVDVIREEPNPGSPNQLKEWLHTMNWIPETFKLSKNTGKMVEQVSLPFGQGLCPSVKDLYEVEPNLVELEGYFVIKHRIGLFKSYIDNEVDGKVYANAHGFTNTMRLTHSKPIANLPKPSVFYGKQVRGVLTIPNDDYIMCGSDVSGLEDNTKQHYIYFFDPDYVIDMRVPGFCPHLDIATLANLMTEEDAEFYKYVDNLSDEEFENLPKGELDRFNQLKKVRHTSKTTNFSATYGAGGPKIAATAKIPVKEGYALHSIYWKRNKAVKQTAKSCKVKVVEHNGRNQKWLYNPISGFWMYLKAEKDRFSTLNQSSGVYIFDFWVRIVRGHLSKLNIPVIMQYHDELLLICKKEFKQQVDNILHSSMEEVNDEVKLNVRLSVSTDWGTNYAECH